MQQVSYKYMGSMQHVNYKYPVSMQQVKYINELNDRFKKNNIIFMSIRGNHDDPSYYKKGKFELSNFKLIEDYPKN